MEQVTVKVLLLGDIGVGKSTLAYHLTHAHLPAAALPPTLSVDLPPATVRVLEDMEVEVKVQLVDVPGNTTFAPVLPAFYRGANVLMLVYDVTRPATFRAVETRWLGEIDRWAPEDALLILIGNKLDGDILTQAPAKRAVSKEDGQALGKRIGAVAFYEISGLTWTHDDLVTMLDATLALAVKICQKTRATASALATAGEVRRLAVSSSSNQGACCGAAS